MLKIKFMAFSFSKLVGKHKNKSIDTIEAIIKDIENIPFGISEENVLYAGLNELGGYYFFQTVVVGPFQIKTFKGADLSLKGADIALQLKSDMLELESNSSSVSKRYITNIDFQVEDSDLEALKDAKITHIQLLAKKEDITFTKYEATDEEEE